VYEEAALHKFTIPILKAIAEHIGIAQKTAKNKKEWVSKILQRAALLHKSKETKEAKGVPQESKSEPPPVVGRKQQQ